MKNRRQKLALNTILSLLLQVINIISGFILPRLIISAYGSDINGLVNSITQFISVISLLDLGVGSVVQSTLYKPLAENDNENISKIFVSANSFFKKIALVLLFYIAVLVFVYPYINSSDFGFKYTAFLIFAMSISTFAQYYFGIVNSLLLTADQRGYIQYSAQIITVILNTIAGVILIFYGCSIHTMKLVSSIIFLIRPLFLNWYVKRNYSIDYKIKIKDEPIKQKWNGMAQHFAAYVLGSTDSIVLTVFSTLENVSVYGVYNIVITGIKNALFSMTNGFQSIIGQMLYKNEKENLNLFFSYVEWFMHTGTTLIFGCTGILLVPFVNVYTNGIDDANYIQPLFAILITIANAGHCLRLPYNIVILAAGHYKQTQNNYIIAMILNIVISVITVKIWGLIGVAIGTLVAMLYQTIWMAWYDSKNIINWPFKKFLKQCVVNITIVIIASLATFKIPMLSVSYVSWFLLAFEVFVIWSVISLVINIIFYRENLLTIIKKIKGRFVK